MRVTVDLDTLDRDLLRKALWMCSRLGTVEVSVSSRRKGVHLVVSDLEMTYLQSAAFRRLIGDDGKRLQFDLEAGLKPKQILWDEKLTSDGSLYRAERVGLLRKGALGWEIDEMLGEIGRVAGGASGSGSQQRLEDFLE